jgi:hypothetical protein
VDVQAAEAVVVVAVVEVQPLPLLVKAAAKLTLPAKLLLCPW